MDTTAYAAAASLDLLWSCLYFIDFDAGSMIDIYNPEDPDAVHSGKKSLENTLYTELSTSVHPEDHKCFKDFFAPDRIRCACKEGRCVDTASVRIKRADGRYRWTRLAAFPVPGKDQGRVFLVCSKDLARQDEPPTHTEAAADAEALRQNLDNLRYKAVVEHTHTLIFEWEGDRLTYISPRIPELLSGLYDGRNPFDVWREAGTVYAGDMEAFDACLSRLALGIKSGEVTVRLRRRDGQFIWCKITYTHLDDGATKDCYIGTLNDVDAATRTEQALRLRAEHDPLTGAYNIQTFFEKIDVLIKKHQEERYCVLRFDVAGFKAINETFGLEEGNRLLRVIARLIRQRLNAGKEAFARITADVFALCLSGGPEKALLFIQELSRYMERYSETFRVKLFFGICPVENTHTPAHILCDWAYLAQKTVKGSDLVNFAFYDDALRKRLHDENYIIDQMDQALEKKQFKLVLQPKVQISSGRIIGAEALVRWQHPADGLILPGRFVPLFESNGFILRLDFYIWDLTCRTLRDWLDRGYDPMPISVNVSRLHFNDDNLPDKLIRLMNTYNLPRHMLELELTESAFFANETIMIRLMHELQAAGFIFSMDDFGTGYSSLITLRDLPFNIVKLDRAFISNGTDNQRGQIVARNTIAMARDLNMFIVAEGVETLEHARFLLNCGCNCAQGFYYSHPMDPVEFEVLSFMQEKAFGVHPLLEQDARCLGLPVSGERPFKDY